MADKVSSQTHMPAIKPVLRRNKSGSTAVMRGVERKLDIRCFSTGLDYNQGNPDKELQRHSNNLSQRTISIQQHSTIRPGSNRSEFFQMANFNKTVDDDCSGGSSGSNIVVTGGKPKSPVETKLPPTKRLLPPTPKQRSAKKAPNSYENCSLIADGEDTQTAPTWNTYLYKLQQEAPQPVCMQCEYEVPGKPTQYGKEFHGSLSRSEADKILQNGDGSYLVRKSERAHDAYSLAIRFNNETKNYKLFYDGKHYVGEKRFDSVHNLVADGLIHFYIELRAGDYINAMAQASNYEESPYMVYNMKRRKPPRSDTNINRITLEVENLNIEEQAGPGTDVQDFEKSHIFKVQNFMGLHWCNFCANFMWGLLAQGVKCQDCGFEAHKKCSEKVPSDCMPDMKYIKRVYGGDLTTVVKAQKSNVPYVVEHCVREIEMRGMDQEGLYRVAGFHDDVEAIRMAFDKDGENADISANKYDDINTICSALKLYFRLLPIPLITLDAYHRLMEFIKKEDVPATEMVRLMKEPLMALPPAHFHALKYMCGHIQRVVQQKSKNMMSFENLAIVFAPTLMRSDDTDPFQSLMATKLEQKIMEVVFVHSPQLLGS